MRFKVLHICARLTLAYVIAVGFAGAVGGCASGGKKGALGPKVSSALLGGRPAEAREELAAALRGRPQDGCLHLLNGLSYQIEDGSQQSAALAKVGYDAAVKFAPGHYWSHYLAGSAALDMSNYGEAAEHFSAAILDDPDRAAGFLGLAVAAYRAGDLEVARVAAERALVLSPQDPLAVRSAAYVAAARGDRARLDAIVATAGGVPAAAEELRLSRGRLGQLVRTASLVGVMAGEVQGAGPATRPAATTGPARGRSGARSSTRPAGGVVGGGDDLNQVMLEVTLLLNQASTSNSTGINLLDGLSVQFGAERTTSDVHKDGARDVETRSFTTAIKVPDITYSLNLFNTRDDHYRVLARPSLVAYLDQESQFFIGRQVTVGVSGVNLGTLQPVDVGTSVRVTPSEITAERTKFKVEVVRSFFDQPSGGTFAQSLTTFKQTVSATAEVEFGRTLILSALYEGVDVGGSSKTPVLGDIPVIDTFFNARTRRERRDVALVLVTPRRPGSIETGEAEFRGETLSNLLSMWKRLIDPASNLDAVTGVLSRRGPAGARVGGAKPDDLRLRPISDPGTIRPAVLETVAQLR